MSNTLLRIAVSLTLGLMLALPFVAATSFVYAADEDAETADDADGLTEADLIDPTFASATGLGTAELQSTIGNIINIVLGFLGIVAVVIVLWGGFKWMTAGGNDEKVGEARKLLIAGVIGLAIILSAYAITSFVVSSLLEASN
ncbi:MAG: pilin [Patescibacteria group bacterium]